MSEPFEGIFEMSAEDILLQAAENAEQIADPSPPLGSNTQWPQIIHNPAFIGSRVQITSLDFNSQPISYEANVVDMSTAPNNELAIILTNVTKGKEFIPGNIILAYDHIKAVTMLDAQPIIENSDSPPPLEDANELINSSPELDIDQHVNNTSKEQFEDQNPDNKRILVSIPYLDNFKIDLFFLQKLYELEMTGETFVQWKCRTGIDAIVTSNALRFGIPMQFEKMDQSLDSTLKIKKLWEDTFVTHFLSFDNWFMSIGNTIYHDWNKNEQIKEVKLKPQEEECTNVDIPMKLISSQFSIESLETSEPIEDFNRDLPEYTKLEPLAITDLDILRITESFDNYPIASSYEHKRAKANLLIQEAIEIIKYGDFLPNGRFAWAFIPCYQHIPRLLLKELGIDYNNPVEKQAITALWMKLQLCRKRADGLIDLGTSPNFMIKKDMNPTHWHSITSKIQIDPLVKTNIIDHVQHWAAWQFYKSNYDKLEQKDIYDLFVRPMECMFGLDNAIHKQLYNCIKETTKRMHILEYVASLTGTKDFIFEKLSPHYLLQQWSEIRHLSTNDLLNNPIKISAPVEPLFTISMENPNAEEPPFGEEEFKPIETLIKHLILRSKSLLFRRKDLPFPLPYTFLKQLSAYDGVYMSLSKQKQIYWYYVDNYKYIKRDHRNFLREKEGTKLINRYTADEFELNYKYDSKESSESFSFTSEKVIEQPETVESPSEINKKKDEATSASKLHSQIQVLNSLVNYAANPSSKEFEIPEETILERELIKTLFDDFTKEKNKREEEWDKQSKAHKENIEREKAQKLFSELSLNNKDLLKDDLTERCFFDGLTQKQNLDTSEFQTSTPSFSLPALSTERTLAQAAAALNAEYKEKYLQVWTHSDFSLSSENTSNSDKMYKIQKSTQASKEDKTQKGFIKALQSKPKRAPVPKRTYAQKTSDSEQEEVFYQDTQLQFPIESFFDRPLPQQRKPQPTQRQQDFAEGEPPQVYQKGKKAQTKQKSEQKYTYRASPRWSASTSEHGSRPHTSQSQARPASAEYKQEPRPIVPALAPAKPKSQNAVTFEKSKTAEKFTPRSELQDSKSKPAPPGQISAKLTPWIISKRKADRMPSNTLANDIPADELTKFLANPSPKEEYKSIYWTTTSLMQTAPRWTTGPHNALTVSQAIEPCPTTKETSPSRFHSSVDLCIFPLDDNMCNRDVHFESFRYDNEWFLRIREEGEQQNDSLDFSSINVSWGKVAQLVEKLEDLMLAPLPPARDMVYTNEGTYTYRMMSDMKRRAFYYMDIIQQSKAKGWLRMIHITQLTPNPENKVVGEITIPWHKLSFFVQMLNEFKDKTA